MDGTALEKHLYSKQLKCLNYITCSPEKRVLRREHQLCGVSICLSNMGEQHWKQSS